MNLNVIRTLFFILLSVSATQAGATTYTAIKSGSYTDPNTWQGGIVPTFKLVGNNSIIIPTGMTVTLTNNFETYGGAATDIMTVNGTLDATSKIVHISGMTFNGTGTITADSFSGDFDYGMAFGGTIDANRIGASSLACNGAVTFNVGLSLFITDTLQMNSGTINMADNSFLVLNGSMSNTQATLRLMTGAALKLPTNYDVWYKGDNVNTGVELSGAGLRNVSIDMNGNLSKVNLSANLTVNKKLFIKSGVLNLNNHNLTFAANSDFEAGVAGSINSSSASDITINSGIAGKLVFFTGGNSVKNMVINSGSNIQVGSNLTVTGKLDFQSGKLDIMANKLSLIAGGTVINADNSKYIITGNGGAVAADVNPNTAMVYHIGTANNYAPCVITSRNNTPYNGFIVGVSQGVTSDAKAGKNISASQPLVDATWILNHDPAYNIAFDAELMWDASMEVNNFDRQKAYITQIKGAIWDKYQTAAAKDTNGMYIIKRENLAQATAIAVFDEKTVDVPQLSQPNISIYPNPATHVLNIKLQERVNTTAYIYNMQGQAVQTVNINNGAATANVSRLTPGVYYLRYTDDIIHTTRFIRQ